MNRHSQMGNQIPIDNRGGDAFRLLETCLFSDGEGYGDGIRNEYGSGIIDGDGFGEGVEVGALGGGIGDSQYGNGMGNGETLPGPIPLSSTTPDDWVLWSAEQTLG